MMSMNLGKPTSIQPLNEAMAIDLGANLLGEVVIFTIGAGLLILEYVRQAHKETMKEEGALQEKRELKATLRELQFQSERQDAQIRELQRVIADVESKTWLPRLTFGKPEVFQTSSSDTELFMKSRENARHIYQLYPSINVVYRALNLIETGQLDGDDDEE